MKLRLSQLAIAALCADVSSAFLASNSGITRSTGVVSYGSTEQRLPTSNAMLSSPIVAEGTASSNDDNHLRQEYDQWRAKYGRGEFDSERFENFKTNLAMLNEANVAARERAIAAGQDPPSWMTLNEYGDYSMQEYQAETQQSSQINGSVSGASITQDDFEEMEKAIDYVTNGDSNDAERLANFKILQEECPDAYMEWCQSVGKEADTTGSRYSAFCMNYAAMRVFTTWTGKVLELNEYADCTKEEHDAMMYGSVNGFSYEEDANPSTSQRKTFFIKDNDPTANPATSTRKTLVIPEASVTGEVAPRGTQVIQKSGTQVIQPRGTQVIQQTGTQTIEPRGTQVMQKSGTQVISRTGTQVIQKAGTQVIQKSGGARAGTQVIQKANANFKGTQVISRSNAAPRGTCTISGDEISQGPFNRGTQVIKEAGAARGTQVVHAANLPVKGTQVVNRTPRGTRVVPRDIADTSGINRPLRGTMVLQSNEQQAATYGLDESNTVNGDNDRSVRGTIVLQKKSEAATGGRRETLIIDKSELDGAIPSLFSFFGGAETRNYNRSGTIVIKKSKSTYHINQDKTKNAALDQISKEVEARRLDALRKRDRPLQASESGPTGSPADLPILHSWTQNADGSITGLISRSVDYKDGTQITTSAVPEGATAGYLVKSVSGTRYLLQ